MKLVFVSNFLNHHQRFLCNELNNEFGDFCFIATKAADGIGYQHSEDAEYVINWYDNAQKQKAKQLIIDADVVIFGDCPNSLINLRSQKNKLFFLYSERFFKKGIWRILVPHIRREIKERIGFKSSNSYVLCASAYITYELSLLGFDCEKCLKWGYFPEFYYYDIDQLCDNKKENSILWVGRLLDWKHPDMAIKLAHMLSKNGIKYNLTIIGDGPMFSKLDSMIRKYSLENQVKLVGSKSVQEVRKTMEESQIFLFTSDSNEGWGAVLNEAMNSGCAIIASHAAGSTPFLIENSKNGYIYKCGDTKEAFSLLLELLHNKKKCKQFGIKAYNSILCKWNAKQAVANFKKFLYDYNSAEFDSGPCSKSEIIKNCLKS